MQPSVQPLITLYRGGDPPQKYSWSPFVTKMEARLRFSKRSYKTARGNPMRSPSGKIPYITLSSPNTPDTTITDSSLILQRLTDTDIIPGWNQPLSAKQRAQDLATRALLEDRLYFLNGCEKWMTNYYIQRDYTLGNILWPMRVAVGYMAWRGNVKKLYDQGAGRFSNEERRGFKREIWEAVEALLMESRTAVSQKNGRKAEKEGNDACWWLLGGDGPTEADASLYGFVCSVLGCDAGPESRTMLKDEFGVVVEWAERVHCGWFPEYEMWS